MENHTYRTRNNRFQCKSDAGIVRLQAKEQLTPRQEEILHKNVLGCSPLGSRPKDTMQSHNRSISFPNKSSTFALSVQAISPVSEILRLQEGKQRRIPNMKQVIQIVLSSLVFITASITPGYAQSIEGKSSFVQLGVFPPISTNGLEAKEYTNTISFNTLVGLSMNERAFTFSGLANIIRNDAQGIQWAGLCNYIGNKGAGVSLAGMANISKTHYDGVQFSGILNMGNEVIGSQFSGVVNFAKKVSGVQFASLINIAEESDYPIGLLNLIKNGEYALTIQHDEIGTTAISLRTGSRFTYGIIGLGYNYKAHEKTLTTIAGLGLHFNCYSWLRINNEVTMQNIGFSRNSTFKAGYALLPSIRIGQHLGLSGGLSLNYLQSRNAGNEGLFSSKSIWEKQTVTLRQQLYVGYQAGIQYIF